VPALNKIDLLKDLEETKRYLEDVEYLTGRLKLDTSMQGLLAYKLCKFLPEISPPVRVLYLSAKKRKGFDELETLAYEHYCTCGDLT